MRKNRSAVPAPSGAPAGTPARVPTAARAPASKQVPGPAPGPAGGVESFPLGANARASVLLLLFLLSRMLPALTMPLVLDEALYVPMIIGQAHEQKLIPTFLEHPVSWKPFLFFSAYSLLRLDAWALPAELPYRLPSVLFGLATIPVLLRIFRNAGVGNGLAFISVLIYLVSFPVIYANAAVLTDTLAFFLICLSLLLYTEKGPRLRYLPAGALAFAAFFAKLVLAFMIPLLALAYLYQFRRKELAEPAFLLSLLAVPLAMAAHFMLMDGAGLASELYFADVGGHVVSAGGLSGQLLLLLDSLTTVISSGVILWLGISIPGFLSRWRDNAFFSAWYALGLVPLLFSSTIFWYFLPVMPAIGYFAACTLGIWKGAERFDRLFAAALCLLLASSLVIAYSGYAALYPKADAEREAGNILSGRDGVLIVGAFRPGIAAYKILGEEARPRDFGWVILSSQVPPEDALLYASDYHSGKYPAINGSFSAFFTRDLVFRKDTNLSRFDYIAAAGPSPPPGNAALLYNKSGIAIYYRG